MHDPHDLIRRILAAAPACPNDSLVERVADGIAETFAPYVTADKPARAVIHAIANWLQQQKLHVATTELRMGVE